jgi:hypothetical protein
MIFKPVANFAAQAKAIWIVVNYIGGFGGCMVLE